MSKNNDFAYAILKLIFNAEPIPGIADDASMGGLTEFWLALHTDDPGEDGDQETFEVAYDGYERVAVSRDQYGWVVHEAPTANDHPFVNPAEHIDFPSSLDGPFIAPHFSIGREETGAGEIFYRGALTPELLINAGTVPRVRAETKIEED